MDNLYLKYFEVKCKFKVVIEIVYVCTNYVINYIEYVFTLYRKIEVKFISLSPYEEEWRINALRGRNFTSKLFIYTHLFAKELFYLLNGAEFRKTLPIKVVEPIKENSFGVHVNSKKTPITTQKELKPSFLPSIGL